MPSMGGPANDSDDEHKMRSAPAALISAAYRSISDGASVPTVRSAYTVAPAASATRLARIHFWLHNLGLPAFMIALWMLLTGNESAGALVGISATVVIIALGVFAMNVLVNAKPAR